MGNLCYSSDNVWAVTNLIQLERIGGNGMYQSKKYAYDWDDIDEGKGPETLIKEILEDPELPSLTELVIGCWGDACDADSSAQPLIDGLVENASHFSGIKSLFIGDMEYEDCELSWIEQGDYSKLWAAMPQLEKMTIKGASGNFNLGALEHSGLKELVIISGGLPVGILKQIEQAKLPSLEVLKLYLGIDNYGGDASLEDIESFLANSDFPKLRYLGLLDSEEQDGIADLVLKSKYMKQLDSLDFSYGCLTDKGGQLIYDALSKDSGIKNLYIEYHYMSTEVVRKLEGLGEKGITTEICDAQEADDYDGELWMNPMYTE